MIRDDWRCRYCGCQLDDWNGSLDHVIPVSRGGGSQRTNLVACCKPCNHAKDDLTAEEFARAGASRRRVPRVAQRSESRPRSPQPKRVPHAESPILRAAIGSVVSVRAPCKKCGPVSRWSSQGTAMTVVGGIVRNNPDRYDASVAKFARRDPTKLVTRCKVCGGWKAAKRAMV